MLKSIKFPPQLNNKGDLAQETGDKVDQSNVELIIGIDKGEIEWDGNMGTKFMNMKHEKNANMNIFSAIAYRDSVDQINDYLTGLRTVSANAEKISEKVDISIKYARTDTLGTVKTGTANIEV
jgi:hypothetical protein